MRPLKNGNFYSSSRKAKISTAGIYGIFRGLKFEPDAEIGQKVLFCKGLVLGVCHLSQFQHTQKTNYSRKYKDIISRF
jgi:hypothetical protein